MDKTKIDWCDSSWNPISGCNHNCEYCYARNIAHRFAGYTISPEFNVVRYPSIERAVLDKPKTIVGKDGKRRVAPYPYGFCPTFHRYKLDEYANKTGRNIFVCSMADLFGDWMPDSWLDEVFEACEKAPQHNYLFLTKNPRRYSKNEYGYGVPIADNMWYGTTITKMDDIDRFNYLPAFCNTFVNIEPLLEDIKPEKCNIMFRQVDWFIIGEETGRKKDKVVPERKWLDDIVTQCRENGKLIFMKSSLASIWGEPLIQEFPDGLRR